MKKNIFSYMGNKCKDTILYNKGMKYIFLGAICIFLLIYYTRIINYRNELYIIYDEVGYWSIAAKYCGFSWDSLMESSLYYSYGYSFLLIPLLLLGIDADVMYKLAILLNGLLVIGTLLLAYKVSKKIFRNISDIEHMIICGCVSLYPFITANINYAWAEIYLYFLFWVLIYIACTLAEKPTALKILGMLLLNILMYFVHQRTVGIFIASVFFIAIVCWNNDYNIIRKKSNWVVVSCVVFLFVLGTMVKEYNVNSIFAESDIISVNNFSGQTSKLKYICSIDGIIDLIKSFLGKYFYLNGATFLLGGISFVLLTRSCCSKIDLFLKKSLLWEDCIQAFVLLACLGMMSITAIFFIGDCKNIQDARVDKIFYGRYFEITLGPMLLYGFNFLKNVKRDKKLIPIVVCIYIISAIVTNGSIIQISNTNRVEFNTYGLNYFWWLEYDYSKIIYKTLLSTLMIGVLVLMLNMKGKPFMYFLSVGVIAICWMIETDKNDQIIINREKENKQYVYTTVDILNEYVDENELCYIYCLEDKNLFKRYAYYLQFNFYDKEIKVEKIQEKEMFELKEEVVYIVMEDTSIKDLFDKNSKLIYGNGRINLYQVPGVN